ncbi:MAG: hypothetical protein ACJAWL_001227 [Motiliproteus sp.]|jgi:hypothetical protein
MQRWIDKPAHFTYSMDLLLLLLFVLACVPQATGLVFHEWESAVFLVPFAIHLLLHWDWITRVPLQLFGKLKGEIKFNVVWDLLIYLMMIFVTLSGFLVSEALVPSLGIDWQSQPFWSELHDTSANLIIPMLGVHLGLHWRWLKSLTLKLVSR